MNGTEPLEQTKLMDSIADEEKGIILMFNNKNEILFRN